VNPAAGQTAPDLKLLNRMIHGAGYDWEVEVTNEFGDGARWAKRAVDDGASFVAACGGDGTVMDVASGLVGRQVPLAILPLGTGNAVAKELNIPINLAGACTLMLDPRTPVRMIDVGVAGERLFLLRVGAGLEAAIVRTADRELKDRLGIFAYFSATFQAWGQAPVSTYHLVIDGQSIDIEGLACMVANAATLGVPGLSIHPQVRVDDGKMDIFVIRRADLSELASLAGSVIGSTAASSLPHWQFQELTLFATPAQEMEADGEELGHTPVHISVMPNALRVISPYGNKPVS
jgi:YegS/Rv2252/BmrU family lipid kinase